jgi:hypothetical protein
MFFLIELNAKPKIAVKRDLAGVMAPRLPTMARSRSEGWNLPPQFKEPYAA